MGAHVVLACRNAEKAQAALEAIRSAHPGKGASVEVMQLDLASLRSARHFADAWASRREEQRRVDLLVCNGGATFVDFAKTEDGFERTYQVSIRPKKIERSKRAARGSRMSLRPEGSRIRGNTRA